MTTAIDRLWQLMEDLEPNFGGLGRAEARRVIPVNVWEDETSFRVEMELPGFRIEDVELEVTGPKLALRAKNALPEREGVGILRRERESREFSRSLEFPVAIDGDKVEARMTRGVLTIRLPKSPSAQPRKIAVRAADRTS